MASQHLLYAWGPAANVRPRTHPNETKITTTTTTTTTTSFFLSAPSHRPSSLPVLRAKPRAEDDKVSPNPKDSKESLVEDEEEVEEEDLPWIQEKAMDLVEFTGTVTQTLPGPRVGQSSLPWILAIPLAYVGLSFVIAFVKTVRKFNSPREKRKKLVNKNAMLCKYLDELFQNGRDEVQHSALVGLVQKTGFSVEEILRKYIRYALNEKPFNPDLVVDLIHLRKVSELEDAKIAEVLNEISRRIVKEKGPVVMDISGFTERGFKRKLAVQALFGKVLYLSELPDFCSRDNSLIVKEIFGVTDEDADSLRIDTLSMAGDMDSLEKMVDSSDTEESCSREDTEKSNGGSDSEKSN